MRKLISILVITLVVSVLYYSNLFFSVSNSLSDIFIHEPRTAETSIKILAIDDESLDQVGRWPWSRDVVSNLSEQLVENGAKAVFVDIVYTEESEDPAQDENWQRILNEHRNIFLPTYFHLDEYQTDSTRLSYQRMNEPIYELASEQIGHINAWESSDRVVREALLGIPTNEGEIIPAMGVRLANLYLDEEYQINWNENNEWFYGDIPIGTGAYSEVYFTYTSTPSFPQFETIPIGKVINGEIDLSYFEESTVLIGPYTVGLQDMYYIPNSNTRMFGVEIHANILQSLLYGWLFYEASTLSSVLIIAFVTALSFFIMELVNARWAILVAIGFIVIYTVIFNTILVNQMVILPFFYVLLTIVACYVTSVVSQYIKEKRERGRVTGIFGRYVSKSVVDEILSTQDEIKLGGERKDVTMLFVDIRGFTPLSEAMQPEEVIIILNEYLDLCTKAIFKYEGTLDKFMGDGVMAIFGAPVPQDDHAHRAVRAALEMKSKADELATRLEEKYGRTVRFGMGINSGPAVIGNIGSQDRLEYTAIGDTVNLAARLESNAKPGQILISDETYNRVKEQFKIEALEEIKVKGKEKMVMIYQVEEEI